MRGNTSISSSSWIIPKGAVSGTNFVGCKKMEGVDILGATRNAVKHDLAKVVCGVYIVNETDDTNAVMSVEFDPSNISGELYIINDTPFNFKATVFINYLI